MNLNRLIEVIFTVACISFVALLYSTYIHYIQGKLLLAYLSLAIFFLTFGTFTFIIYSLFSTYFACRGVDRDLEEYVCGTWIPCQNLLCPRCFAFYLSFILVFMSIFYDQVFWANLAHRFGAKITLVLSMISILFATPIHGTITRTAERLDNRIIKFCMGLLSGFSLATLAGALVDLFNLV
ncbi:MAG: hypothetical protein V3R86_08155 [Candidatus Hydrothermarchaeaceae archaeon]